MMASVMELGDGGSWKIRFIIVQLDRGLDTEESVLWGWVEKSPDRRPLLVPMWGVPRARLVIGFRPDGLPTPAGKRAATFLQFNNPMEIYLHIPKDFLVHHLRSLLVCELN
jgi:hypothetical protein